MDRFAGLDRAHGYYRPQGVERADGKNEGFAETIKAPVTVEMWEGHLGGHYGIGMVPIRDDATCVWGAIDVDLEKKPDLNAIAGDVTRLELPLIPCRSKSGGVHLYLFCSEPVPASLIRTKLMEWAVTIGYSGVEVFPKQSKLASNRDIGNWINMPYFAATSPEGTSRFAVNTSGERLTLGQFLILADTLAVTHKELEELKPPEMTTFGGALEEAPPCLQCIAGKGGAGEGYRNKALFNYAVYLRNRHGDQWEQYFDAYNVPPYVSAPVTSKELQQIVRNVNKKSYKYTCNEAPLDANCSRQICLTRKFGIGNGADSGDPGVVFGGLVKLLTTPPTWIWDVDGERLELSTEQLKDQTRFHTVCMERINKWPRLLKPGDWAQLIRDKLQHVEEVDVPPDAKPEGQMWQHLQTYTTGRVRARTREELINDKPWEPSPEDAERYGDQVKVGRVYFKSTHFKQYLEQQRMTGITERKLWGWLRNRQAEHHYFNINGKSVTCWSVPAFPKQTDPFSVPRIEEM